jgi:hypothetical protein
VAIETYVALAALADGEGLIYYGQRTRTPLPAELEALLDGGMVQMYFGSRDARVYLWLLDGCTAPGESALPAPSIYSHPVLAAYVRRDRGICHLCRYRVVPNHRYAEARPSLDHLVPRVEGGSDYPSNLAVAHQSCNKARRDLPIEVARARESERSPWWRRHVA